MKHEAKRNTAGFTLVEILVAFLIFSIIGVVSSQLLSQTIDAQSKLSDRGERLSNLHRAMQVIQRDIMQLADRPIRDQYGDPLQTLMIGSDGAIEFSRVGWRNPLKLRRAEVQRVAYRIQDNNLMRGSWSVLDRAQDTLPAYQTLLRDVEQIEFYALDSGGNEHSFWPQRPDEQSASTGEIFGIILRIDIPPYGVIERVWEVPNV